MAISKRLAAANSKVDRNKLYSLEEAVALVKETSQVKFDATVEIHLNLGIDPKKSDQLIRSTVSLPHGNGKSKKVAAFVGANDEAAAKSAGADVIYTEENIKKLNDGKIDFEIAVATPEMMPKMAVVAKVLGPKGLMPNPKSGTVDKDIAKVIKEMKGGKIAFKNDDTANVHASIGRVSFSPAQLLENLTAFLDTIKKIKPASSKGTYIKSAFLVSSMGPSIKLSVG